MKAETTKIIKCPALGFSILKGAIFDIIHIGEIYSSCCNLGISLVWNDEFELLPPEPPIFLDLGSNI